MKTGLVIKLDLKQEERMFFKIKKKKKNLDKTKNS